MEVISSKNSQLIKSYTKLMTSKSERMAEQLFVAEGLRIVTDALTAGDVKKLIMTNEAYEKHENSGFLAQVDLRKVQLHIISNELGAKISDTKTTQGIFAVCGMKDNAETADLFSDKLSKGGKYIVLHKLQDPGNVGMIIRTAEAMGIDGVIISSGSCDIYNPKTVRGTMGSVFRVPIWNDVDIEAVLSVCRENSVCTFAAVPNNTVYDVKQTDFGGASAVFIGNEGNGLDDDVINACDKAVTIKMGGNVESLNAAMAAGIMMWQMTGGQA